MEEKEDWDEVYRINYENKAFREIYWIHTAESLIKSATLIEPVINDIWKSVKEQRYSPEPDISYDYYTGAYFMLMSYAIENIFKAIIVNRNSIIFKQKFRENQKFPVKLKEHDLVNLAESAKFKYNPEQENLLRRLTRCAIWYGRYPVPLDYKKTRNSEKFKDQKFYPTGWFGATDSKKIKDLISNLRIEFKDIFSL